jgi:putative Ig domain-containing protein
MNDSGMMSALVRLNRISKAQIVWPALAIAVLAHAQPAAAANYPLEIIAPRANLPTHHRMLRAYPGLTYAIRAAVVGGAYPYVYSLSNAPVDMTIDPATGEINWTNPQTTTTVTLTVTDFEGTRVSQTWTITVTSGGFRFVDAVNGSSTGSGSPGNPLRTLSDVYNRSLWNDIVYFKTGTYDTTGIPAFDVGTELSVEFDQSSNSVMWLAYPGAAPVIDFMYTGTPTPRIRLIGNAIYIDGFALTRIQTVGFQVGHSSGLGSIFRRLNARDLLNGVDGSNAAFIMTMNTGAGLEADGMVVQDSTFTNNTGMSAALKLNYTTKLLVENCTFTTGGNETLALRMRNRQFTIRGNTFSNITNDAISGNMFDGDDANDHGHYGEVLFNNVRDARTAALVMNLQGEAGPTYVYRNTFQGRVLVTNTSSDDGPFSFSYNVIVNSDTGTPTGSHIQQQNVSAPSRVLISNNLVGFPTDGIVDAAGNLTAAFASYIGTHGHMRGGGAPRPATNVRITR